jgi:ABC-type multidrug transport system ATPase subunit
MSSSASASELAVWTEDLGKRFDSGVVAVSGLDLRVREGEVYGFLGRNGAGKTTTMRMLAGLIRPTSGSVTVFGRPAGHPAALADIGTLIESPTLYPHLSGRDNLCLLAHYAGVTPSRVDEVLEEVGLAGRETDKFRTYSLGMKQRLGVAAALLKQPRLLILDEPTNGLDPSGMADMRALVRSIGQGQRTVLLSSHLLGEVEQICDRVGVIQQGRLVAEGTVEDLRAESGPSLVVVAEPVSTAVDVLRGLSFVQEATADGTTLRVRAEAGRAAEVNAELVRAGVAVSELRQVERSLEEVFLELTDEPVDESREHAEAVAR